LFGGQISGADFCGSADMDSVGGHVFFFFFSFVYAQALGRQYYNAAMSVGCWYIIEIFVVLLVGEEWL